jgi:hypothetical protein
MECVGVGYAEVVGYWCDVLGVDVGIVGVELGMPSAARDDAGIGVECRCGLKSRGCEACASDLIGWLEVAEAEDTARARTAWVSRRRLGPSLTLGWV